MNTTITVEGRPPIPTTGPNSRPALRRHRTVLVTRLHESAALLLAAAGLWSAAAQLAGTDGWGRWAPPLAVSAVLAGARGASAWLCPSIPRRWNRAALWGALAIATPVALSTLTTTDYSALVSCQLLLIAGWLAELSAKPRSLAFLWAVPATAALGVLLYHSTL